MTVSDLNDIQKLLEAGIEEGITLEYKEKVGKNVEIAKDICAFANTAGGTIIYGIIAADRIPKSIAWIRDKGIEEQIQNIVSTAIYPIIEGVKVVRIPNNDLEAVYIVNIPKSNVAPHMAQYRYYRRQGSISAPMDDIEVRNAIFGSGRNSALQFEISQNLELAHNTLTLIERVYVLPTGERQVIALVPFHRDAWNSVVASGLLSSLHTDIGKQLVEAYRIMYEINSLIEWLKVGQIAHTPVDMSSARRGTYLPAIIRDKITPMISMLNVIKDQLGAITEETARI